MKVIRAALVLVAVVVAATVANVALLRAAGGGREPVGTLSPRAELRPAAPSPPLPPKIEPGERADD